MRFRVVIALLALMLLATTSTSLAGSPGVTAEVSFQAQKVEKPGEKDYLEKLFGPLSSGGSSETRQPLISGPLYWPIAVLATVFYGQLALLAILGILFTSDLIGIICGLIVIGFCLAFIVPRRPRPIALVVLALVNFCLGLSIVLVVAVQEGVPAVLVSLVPLAASVWLAVRYALPGLKRISVEERGTRSEE